MKDNLLKRARQYAQRNALVLCDELGAGVHGIVLATESQPEIGPPDILAAIKVYQHERDYLQERNVYLRLREHGVTTIRGCRVPQMLRCDDALWVLEMTVVSRPFVLDFGGAVLDEPVEFSDEILADWRLEKAEQFGQRWPEVQAILRALEGYGIFQLDVHPGNISFEAGAVADSSS